MISGVSSSLFCIMNHFAVIKDLVIKDLSARKRYICIVETDLSGINKVLCFAESYLARRSILHSNSIRKFVRF